MIVQFSMKNKRKMQYPDMRLYEEIIFLDNFFTNKWVVENVVSYYEPLIQPQKRGRHYYWSNFLIPSDLNERKSPTMTRNKNELAKWIEFYNYNFNKYKGKQDKRRLARNMIDYNVGKVILDAAVGITQKMNVNQLELVV